MARAVTNKRRTEPVKHVLASLHWLPAEYRVQIKIVISTFKVLTTQEPSSLSELIRLHTTSRHLRSSSCNPGATALGGQGGRAPTLVKIRVGIAHPGLTT